MEAVIIFILLVKAFQHIGLWLDVGAWMLILIAASVLIRALAGRRKEAGKSDF